MITGECTFSGDGVTGTGDNGEGDGEMSTRDGSNSLTSCDFCLHNINHAYNYKCR